MNLNEKRAIYFFLLLAAGQAQVSASPAQPHAPATRAAGSPSAAPVKAEVVPPAQQTLWDVMSKMHADEEARKAQQALLASEPRRAPLGAVPGFTVPEATGNNSDLLTGTPHKTGGFLGQMGLWIKNLEHSTGSSIKITGHSNFTFSMQNVSSSSSQAQAYNSQYYYGRGSGGFYNDTDVDINATLFHSLHYHTHISNYLYGQPDQNRFDINYLHNGLHIEAGDINASMQGNSLIAFSRYLSGIEISNSWSKHFSTSLLVSQTRATPHTLVIAGNNTAGPYYLFAGQIVDGSAQVRVDNQLLQQGVDYTLDPLTGQLNFKNNRVILSSSTIAISYESLGYNQNQGSIYGLNASYSPHSGTSYGVTYLSQITQGSTAPQAITESDYGNPNPFSVYQLQYPVDQSKPVILKVEGVPKVEGVDFTVDPSFPNQIRLVAGVPTTQTVVIQYTPLNTNPTPGNRSIVGLNSSFTLGKLGSLTLESAFSGLNLQGKGINGQALQMRASLHPAKNVNTSLTIRDIGPSFTAIESPGFNQNEKSIAFTTDYTPSRKLNFNLSWQKAKRPSYTSVSGSAYTVSTAGNDSYNQYSLGANYSFVHNGTLSLERNSMSTQFAAGGQSSNLTDSLMLHYTIGTLGLQAGLTRNQSDTSSFYSSLVTTGGLTTTTTTPSTTLLSYNTNTLSTTLGLNWAPRSWVQFNASLTNNNIHSTGSGVTAQNSLNNARTAQAGANFTLGRGLHLQYSYMLSNSGNSLASASTTTTGTSTGTSTGSGTTTGVSSGVVSTRDISSLSGSVLSGGTNAGLGSVGNYGGLLGSTVQTGLTSLNGKTTTQQLGISYSPGSMLQTSLSALLSSSSGTYQYNSTSSDLTFNMSWQPHGGMTYIFSSALTHAAYSNNVGGSNVVTMDFETDGHPFRSKLSLHLGYMILHNTSNFNTASLTTGSTATTPTASTNTSSDSTSLSLRLEYPVTRLNSLFVNWQNTVSTGYLASTQNTLSFGTNFLLSRTLKFSLGWQFANSVTSGAGSSAYNYHISSLLAQMGLNF